MALTIDIPVAYDTYNTVVLDNTLSMTISAGSNDTVILTLDQSRKLRVRKSDMTILARLILMSEEKNDTI